MEKKTSSLNEVLGRLAKYKYILLVLLVGLVLIMLPTGEGAGNANESEVPESPGAPDFSLAAEEERLRETLSAIDGAGEVMVLLSLYGTASRELATAGDETVVVSKGSGAQSAIELRYVYPEYQGAAIVCSGADDARVRFSVTETVRAFTGLGADKITVIKMK